MLILTTARYSFKYDYLQWFNLNDVIDCQENQVQVIGLGQYQCVSFLAQCNGLQGVQNIDYNGKKYLCNDKFQFNQQIKKLGEREFFFIGLIDISQYSIGIDFTAEGEISYALFQLDFECQLSFSWIDQNNQRQIDCLFCKSFYYNKKCSKWAEGYSEASIFLNSVGDVQCNICIYMKACNIKCKSCSYMYLNQCIECADFYYGNGCNNICSLSCDKETCNCFNGLFQSCKAGYIQEVNVDGSINCLALCGIYCSSCVQINSLYTCNQCGYYQKFGTKKFLDAQMVNDVCVGIENCLEYKKITNQFGQMSITCYFCFPGFYYKSDQMKCLECSSAISNCAFCSKYDPVDCIACQFGYYVNNDKTCSKSFIDCNSPCKFCLGSNKDFCTVCIENYYIANYLGNCVCSDGYFDSGNPTNPCQSCHPICATCTGGNISDCTSCKVDQNRKLVKGECICDVGFGEIDDTQQNLTCERRYIFYIQFVTINVELVSTQIINKVVQIILLQIQQFIQFLYFINTSCKYEQNREVSETLECVCKENYGDNLGNLDICYKCHYTCGNCNGTTAQDCSYCTSNRYLTSNNECKCKKNYYENSIQSIICLSCHHSCSNCLLNGNEDNCTECPITRISSSNTSRFKCICKEINYFDDGINQECQQCHYSCKTCNGFQNYECLTCDITYRVQTQNNCQCPQHYYDIGTLICSQCHYSCLSCYDNQISSCYECSIDEDFRFFKEGMCYCQNGYFDDGSQSVCQRCSYKCLTCSDMTGTCIECAEFSFRELGNDNSCSCPVHFLEISNESKCQKCHFKCLDCNGLNSNNCIQCDETQNRQLSNSSCLCKPHYYEIEVENCSICSSYCYECENSFNLCTSCQIDRVLIGNTCFCATKEDGLIISTFDYFGQVSCKKCHYSCLTCSSIAEQNCLSCLNSEFRLFQNGKCPCVDGYVDVGQPQCKKCSYNCKNCNIQSTFCTSCQENSLRILNISVKSCPCQIGYFDDGSNPICQICNYTCESCQIKSTLCLTCPLNSQRILNDILQQCNCNQFYYDNGQKYCEQCHYSCLYCNGNQYNNCIQCQQTNLTFRYLKNNQCLCLDGYYDINSIICDKCQIQCLTCINQSFQCQSCVYTRKLQNNDCICKQGYYDIGYKDCIECNENCFECKLSSQNCISCNPLLFRELNQLTSKCVCMDGYIEINNLCEKCYYQCKTCSISKEQCDTCPINRKFIGNQCFCNEGSFDDGTDCQICHKSCQTCQSIDNYCLTCSIINHRIFQSNKCICEDGYYENTVSISCEKCSNLCQTCDYSVNYCLTCNVNQELDLITNTCLCQKGYFQDISTQSCLQCHISCLECETFYKCKQCSVETRIFNEITNKCDCLQGYYETNQIECKKCISTCQSCNSNQNNCSSCSILHHRELINNTCLCMIGYYDVGIEICQLCQNTCQTCTLSSSFCLKCYDVQFRELFNNACICISRYFDQGATICSKCSNSCKTCSGSYDHCTSCDINEKRVDQSKIFRCPCFLGYFEDQNKTCQKCNQKCETCVNSKDQCLSCSKVLNSHRQTLIDQCNCKDGYFDDGINVACQICNQICLTCTQNATTCLICSNNLRNTPPLCKCKDGFFEDQNKACLQCSNQCQTCIDNKSNCQTCKIGRFGKECKCEDGYYEADLEKCQPCYFQCQTCQLADNCLICKGDRIEPPYCYCKEGYFDDDQSLNCQPCDPTCKTCTISGCLTCNANRILSSELTCDPPEGSIIYDTTPWCSDCEVAVIKVNFSDDLNSVHIKFDFPLKQFVLNSLQLNLCDQVLGQNTIKKLGFKYNCQISNEDSQLFIIFLDYESNLMIDDQIEFNSDILTHIDCDKMLKTFIFSQVKLSDNPMPPIVQFDVPNFHLSPCIENIILNNYTGNDGKRQLKMITWSYICHHQSDTNQLDEFLITLNQFKTLNLIIPATVLPESSHITFHVLCQNFANQATSIQFDIKTEATSFPSITNNMKVNYFPYEKVIFSLQIYSFTICKNSILQLSNSQVHQLQVMEIENNNSQAKQSGVNIQTDILNSTFFLTIPEYQLSSLTSYIFQITTINKITQQQSTKNIAINILQAELFCQFTNITNIQNFRKDLNIYIQCKDLNINLDWNEDQEITVLVSCTDLFTSQPCRNQNQEIIQIKDNSYNQQILKYTIKPYSVQQWCVRAYKNKLIGKFQVIVVFLEETIVPLSIQFNQGYLMRTISNYEFLNFTYDIPSYMKRNLSELSLGILYDFQIVAFINPIFYNLQIRIYDLFQDFKSDAKINLIFQAQFTHSITPSQTQIALKMNELPNCGNLLLEPTINQSLVFLKVGISCGYSNNFPFRFKLKYFFLKEDLHKYISGITDFSLGSQYFQYSNNFQIYLPNQFQNNSIQLLIQVIDSKGSKVNKFDEFSHQSQILDCNLNISQITDIQYKIALMFSSLNIQNNDVCIKLSQTIFSEIVTLSLNSDLQQKSQYFQALKVYKRLLLLKTQFKSENKRILNTDLSQYCYNAATNQLLISDQNETIYQINSTLLQEYQILISKLQNSINQIIEQKQTLQSQLRNSVMIWDQEISDQLYDQVSYLQAIIQIIDDFYSQFIKITQENEEIYVIIEKLTRFLNIIIKEIYLESVEGDKIFTFPADNFQIQLQKMTKQGFQTEFHLIDSIDNDLIQYYLKQLIHFKQNHYKFSQKVNQTIINKVNFSKITFDPYNLYSLNLSLINQNNKYIELGFFQKITIPIREFNLCNSENYKSQTYNKTHIHCIQQLSNQSYTSCALQINNISHEKVQANCQCSNLGVIFLVFSQNFTQVQNMSERLQEILIPQNFSLNFYNFFFYEQSIYLITIFIGYFLIQKKDKKYQTEILKQQNKEEKNEKSDTSIKKEILIYPGHMKIVVKNYFYLHNILSLFQYQDDIVRRPFNFLELSLEINLILFFVVLLHSILPTPTDFIISIPLLIILFLFCRGFFKILKGFYRLKIVLSWIINIILYLLILGSCILIVISTNNFESTWQITCCWFLIIFIYEIFFEPILIILRIHIYSIILPQIRLRIIEKISHFFYYFAWHWKLEYEMNIFDII